VRLNTAVFSSDYTNMQLTYRGPAPAGVAPFITNAGKTSIDGAEVELNWLPSDAWRVDASVGYLDATIDNLTNIPLAVLPPGLAVGNYLPYAPEWQAHLGLGYEGQMAGLTVAPRLDASLQTSTYFDATNTAEIAQLEDITTVNASVRFSRGSDSPWNVIVGLNNATDEIYPVAGNSSLTTGSGYAEVAYARPREWFLNFQYEF
jgi:iron complex outermembrane recepter protein